MIRKTLKDSILYLDDIWILLSMKPIELGDLQIKEQNAFLLKFHVKEMHFLKTSTPLFLLESFQIHLKNGLKVLTKTQLFNHLAKMLLKIICFKNKLLEDNHYYKN